MNAFDVSWQWEVFRYICKPRRKTVSVHAFEKEVIENVLSASVTISKSFIIGLVQQTLDQFD